MQASGPGAILVPVVALSTLLGLFGPLSAQQTERVTESSQAIRAAVTAAESWLDLIDGGRYEIARDSAGVELRDVVTGPAWERRISTVRQGIGALRERSVESTEETESLPGGDEGDYVVVTFDSSFGVLTEAVETVIVSRQGDGEWRPIGYFVRPAEEAPGRTVHGRR